MQRAPLLAPLLACGGALAQAVSPTPVAAPDPIVVTATRTERGTLDIPASIDVVDGARIREGQAQVNLSETLPTLPGIVANHRQNYAQDLQVSIRGFGARSTFGVRGLRILVDGIPATLPDGQAQVSHVDLGSADRIEVLRGPFSVLYGNSAGGVINITTRLPRAGEHEATATLLAGSDATQRLGATWGAGSDALAGLASVSRFEADGYRDHSRVARTTANALVRARPSPSTTVTVVANALDMPDTQDPLGLTRAQFESAPRSVDPVALEFDTRKSVDQRQAGLVLDHAMGATALRLATYAGNRGTQQFQSIPLAPQANALHPGGVIDLARDYHGIDARWTASTPALTVVIGASADRLTEDRRGFQNFSGARIGVQGALRRDETNRVDEAGAFVQGEWTPSPAWRVHAGVRASRVTFRSADHYVTSANPDDSGRARFSATTPVAGVSWRAEPRLALYGAVGRGFETPTTTELAYRPGGATGLNFDLAPAKSVHAEVGAKWSERSGWRAGAALFRADTDDEIVVLTNTGGRATFRNGGSTRREGLELQAGREWAHGLGIALAFTRLDARYREGFAGTSGNRIPGVARTTAHAELRWRAPSAFDLALEAHHSARIPVNDANSDAAPGYTVAALRVARTWRAGGASLRFFVRVDNVFDRRYAGSVIVNEGNARFFEPAPGRTWLAGVTVGG